MKMIGKSRAPLTPRPGEINAALSLLNVMGGGKPKMREHLQDLRAALEHNQKLLAEINEKLKALSDLEKRERELAVVEARADAKLAELAAIRDSFDRYSSDLKAGTL